MNCRVVLLLLHSLTGMPFNFQSGQGNQRMVFQRPEVAENQLSEIVFAVDTCVVSVCMHRLHVNIIPI